LGLVAEWTSEIYWRGAHGGALTVRMLAVAVCSLGSDAIATILVLCSRKLCNFEQTVTRATFSLTSKYGPSPPGRAVRLRWRSPDGLRHFHLICRSAFHFSY
jgi:hypothetical protein